MSDKHLIHPTALVHPDAILGPGTKVGAYSIVEEHVRTGPNCDIHPHAIVRGHTTLGAECKVYPGCVIGSDPQHFKYNGEPTTVVIGDRVTMRECVTVHRGTDVGIRTTRIGDDTYLMAYTHIAHDCEIGKSVIIANTGQIAGHVVIEDKVTIGGQSAVAQFCRVGRYCYVGGGSIIRKDLPPFLVGKGNEFEVQGINVIGLTRAGFSEKTVRNLKTVYKAFFLSNQTVGKAIEEITVGLGDRDEVRLFLDFVRSSKLGFHR